MIPKIGAGAHGVPPSGAPATASEHVPHDVTVDVSVFPSQLLIVETLRRPIESTQDVPVIDVYSFFREQDSLFGDESHFTEEGHRLAARLIFDVLRTMVPTGQ